MSQAGFKATVESFNYKVDTLMRTFGPLSRSRRLSHQQCTALGRTIQQPVQQEAIANLVYGGRMGNPWLVMVGKYRGRGLIQITGLNNYRECGAALKLDLVAAPERLEDDLNAMRSAGWFWNANNCGRYSDDVERCTLVVNGGRNGLAARQALYERAMSWHELVPIIAR